MPAGYLVGSDDVRVITVELIVCSIAAKNKILWQNVLSGIRCLVAVLAGA